jgi:hypothetical protein
MTHATTTISTGAKQRFDTVIQTLNGMEYGYLMRLIDNFRGEITAEHAEEMIEAVFKACRCA